MTPTLFLIDDPKEQPLTSLKLLTFIHVWGGACQTGTLHYELNDPKIFYDPAYPLAAEKADLDRLAKTHPLPGLVVETGKHQWVIAEEGLEEGISDLGDLRLLILTNSPEPEDEVAESFRRRWMVGRETQIKAFREARYPNGKLLVDRLIDTYQEDILRKLAKRKDMPHSPLRDLLCDVLGRENLQERFGKAIVPDSGLVANTKGQIHRSSKKLNRAMPYPIGLPTIRDTRFAAYLFLLAMTAIGGTWTLSFGNARIVPSGVLYALSLALFGQLVFTDGHRPMKVIRASVLVTITTVAMLNIYSVLQGNPETAIPWRPVLASPLAIWISHLLQVRLQLAYMPVTRGNQRLSFVLSTALSQMVDTSIFLSVGFFGFGRDGITADHLLASMIGQFSMKMLVVLILTPITFPDSDDNGNHGQMRRETA